MENGVWVRVFRLRRLRGSAAACDSCPRERDGLRDSSRPSVRPSSSPSLSPSRLPFLRTRSTCGTRTTCCCRAAMAAAASQGSGRTSPVLLRLERVTLDMVRWEWSFLPIHVEWIAQSGADSRRKRLGTRNVVGGTIVVARKAPNSAGRRGWCRGSGVGQFTGLDHHRMHHVHRMRSTAAREPFTGARYASPCCAGRTRAVEGAEE